MPQVIVRGSPIANVAEMLGRTGRCANVGCMTSSIRLSVDVIRQLREADELRPGCLGSRCGEESGALGT